MDDDKHCKAFDCPDLTQGKARCGMHSECAVFFFRLINRFYVEAKPHNLDALCASLFPLSV